MERWQKPEAENPCIAPSNDHPHRSSLDYNTPLRSARGNVSNSPSPFYKLSSELSRESMRIPGAIPFMWEQSPGRQKFPTSIACTPPCVQPPPALPKFSTASIDTDPAKPSLATLFRQPSVKGHVMGSRVAQPLATPAVPQIAPPPATDRPRSSSACYSTLQRNTPTSSLPKNADAFADAASDSASDVLTATAGGVSVDDSLMLSGPLRPSSTPSEARDFIMHRFLPAACTIACESPQTPSRRFLPLSNSVAPTPQTPSRCNGPVRDYGVAACTESWLKTANSPSVFTANSSMPTLRRWPFLEERFHGHNSGIDHSSDEDEEEPPSTPKACGIFPFRIHISLHIHHSTKHANSSSKHHHPTKRQEHHKKSSKSTSSSQTPKRIIDVLQEDRSCTHEDESFVYHFRSRHFEVERERSRIADIKQTAIQYFSPRHLYSSDSYCRGSSQPHQNVAMQRSSSDLNHEECSDYGSYYDAPSRFCSPSLAALHLVNGRTSRANMLNSTLAASLRGTRSSIGSIDNNPHPEILRSTEPHLHESRICSYHMHISTNNNKPHSYHPQLASPSCLSPQSSQMSSSHESTISKGSNTDRYWEAFPNVNQSEERMRMINNALYEQDEQETNNMSCAIHPSMLMSPTIAAYLSNGTRIEHGNGMQAGDAESQEHTNGNIHVKQSARSSSNSDSHTASNGDDNARDGDLHGTCHVGNGDGQHVCSTHKMSNVCDGVHYTCNSIHCVRNCGNLNACNGAPYMDNKVHCAGNGGIHAWHGGHYVCDQSVGDGAMHDVTHAGDWHEAKMGIHNMSRNLVSPPLPNSPTHSWLDRARPLLNSTSRSPNTSSRYKPIEPAAAGDGARKSEQASAAPLHDADSKWEALVKGSHFQPGYLRFSEELFHQSRTITDAN